MEGHTSRENGRLDIEWRGTNIMTVAKARRQLTKQINHDVSIYPLRRPHRDGTHFLPPNTPKDTPTGSIQIIYALRLFQKSLVRNMKLVPGYPRWWLILHLKWGRRRGYEREGGCNNTTILAWGIGGNNVTLNLRGSGGFVRHSWVPAVLFSRGMILTKLLRPEAWKKDIHPQKYSPRGGLQMIYMTSTQFPACWWAGACFGGWVWSNNTQNKNCVGKRR